MKNLEDPIGNRTHELLASSTVPQPSALSHTFGFQYYSNFIELPHVKINVPSYI
jgi:hypothetical protein